MGKKKGGQKMSLNDFLSAGGPEEAPGSWADEMMDLPTAPASAAVDRDSLPSGPRGASNRFSDRPRKEYESAPRNRREGPVELPTSAPYIAYVANLSYSLTEQDLRDFFADSKVLSVRIPINHENQKPRGFAYVEFEDVESLSKAIDLTDKELHGRSVFINVAEQKERAPSERNDPWRRDNPVVTEAPKASETANFWRRDGPAESSSPRNSGFSNRRFEPRENSDRRFEPREREPRAAAPSSFADGVSDWRSGGSANKTNVFSNNRNSQPKGDDNRFGSSSGGVRKKLELLPRSKPSE
ncbi:RNA-binding domain-containing protein [Neoconidiobolus thromboides FSU 785]|nr:RNA-binding domain-containing protein [Neoconidiobolus thromboides FSU 785]